ncbi:hypothetical protein GQ457_09G022420 [Hibiscus cannabinus]
MAPPEMEFDDELVSEAQVFSNKRINVCLTRTNFLLWKQHVVLMIRGLGLEGYLDGSITAPIKLVQNKACEQVVNHLYLQFGKQDSSLASWLLSTICYDILPQLVGSEPTHAVWGVVTKSFSTLSTNKIMNLHCLLCSLKKYAQSMQEYTMNVKETCDLLATCGSHVSELQHIATILNGLPIKYEPSVAGITASKEAYSVDNVVSILIDVETRLEDSSRFFVASTTGVEEDACFSANVQLASGSGTPSQGHDLHSTSRDDQGPVGAATWSSGDDQIPQFPAAESVCDPTTDAIDPDHHSSCQDRHHSSCASQEAGPSNHLIIASDPTYESTSTLVRLSVAEAREVFPELRDYGKC